MKEFELIPAVDLLDGKVVRLHQGRYDNVTVYGDDPVKQVRQFVDDGAKIIHIVDLNAARNGDRSANKSALDSILKITGEFNGAIEIGGGIRGVDALEDYFSRGVSRCILGTAAVSDPEFLKAALHKYGPEKIIVGVDAKDGRVKVAGWEKDGGVSVEDFLPAIETAGAREIIFTDILTDGAMTGPSILSLLNAVEVSDLRIIASGGISSPEDVQSLLDFKRDTDAKFKNERIIGAISGRAIYEGKLKVKEAFSLIHSQLG
ncbi:MAG: 1-(5-phosphoribosyl)-5-[(5-phosphoribosylamino)methylideneamino]imidazole-4-carboxamide isomerase [Spirochaetia bacterium]|nr:1-(5-phosphoribosyl)-5-[(5-phosphoribosylamino)methylideneamino]imidazole-4-carboxamide isomerase [Spirochaetia bacterium]